MARDHSDHWEIIERLRREIVEWSSTIGAPIHRIEYVATFEDFDDGIEIYIFFDTAENLRAFSKDRLTEAIEKEFKLRLRATNYDFSAFGRINVVFDTDENVRRRYGGSYFDRLR